MVQILWFLANPFVAHGIGQSDEKPMALGGCGRFQSSLVDSHQPLCWFPAAPEPIIQKAFSHHRPPGPVSHNRMHGPACCSELWSPQRHWSWPFYAGKTDWPSDRFERHDAKPPRMPRTNTYCRFCGSPRPCSCRWTDAGRLHTSSMIVRPKMMPTPGIVKSFLKAS